MRRHMALALAGQLQTNLEKDGLHHAVALLKRLTSADAGRALSVLDPRHCATLLDSMVRAASSSLAIAPHMRHFLRLEVVRF